MNLKSNNILFLIALLFVVGCAPSRHVKTLNKGQSAVSANLGGPMINLFGTSVFIPFSSLEIGHGLKDDITLFGGIHTTALLFSTVQTDIGITKRWLQPDSLNKLIPGISTSFVANTMIDTKEGAVNFYPEIDVNAYWEYRKNKNHFIYIGIGNWFDLSINRAHNESQQTHWIFNPHVGHTWQRENWNYNLEFKYLAPNLSNENMVVDYVKIFGSKGASGIYFGVTRRF